MTDQGFSVDQISPEQFAELVANASDDQIEEAIHAVGTKETLNRIFDNFPERFQPDKAKGVDADIQFVVTDQGEEFPHVVSVRNGRARPKSEQSTIPR